MSRLHHVRGGSCVNRVGGDERKRHAQARQLVHGDRLLADEARATEAREDAVHSAGAFEVVLLAEGGPAGRVEARSAEEESCY